MTNPLQPAPRDSARKIWRFSPITWKLAVAVGVIGFFTSVGGSSTTTVNGAVDCDGLDLATFITAGLVLVLTAAGYRTLMAGHPARRLAPTTRWIVVGVLVALAVAHLVRGLVNPAGDFC